MTCSFGGGVYPSIRTGTSPMLQKTSGTRPASVAASLMVLYFYWVYILALVIARGLVEAQGGVIEVAARPEGGAEFTVRLPAAG